jgi:hypothetical protein
MESPNGQGWMIKASFWMNLDRVWEEKGRDFMPIYVV